MANASFYEATLGDTIEVHVALNRSTDPRSWMAGCNPARLKGNEVSDSLRLLDTILTYPADSCCPWWPHWGKAWSLLAMVVAANILSGDLRIKVFL